MKSLSPKKYKDEPHFPSAKWRPLSARQKAVLSILAREAYDLIDDDSETLSEFRHRVSNETIDCRISDASQRHYLPLKAAFEQLLGRSSAATQTVVRQIDNNRRVALHVLKDNLRQRNLDISYAKAICETQYKTDLDSATVAQLWQLVYTVRSRRKPISR